jgi:hypothetical protein
MKNKINVYSIKDISEWQKEISINNSKISLPSLQRGFVWKPHQIENLWDSILRGYPVGSVLMSNDQDNNRELLDGQQRCTSIALGFFDPFNEDSPKEILNLKNYLPSLWIDLKPIQLTDERKYIIKVLTKSHPWGFYTKREKGVFQTLKMQDRKKAKMLFFENKKNNNELDNDIKIDDLSYIDLSPKDIYPWDSNYPFPLSWLLNYDYNITIEDFLSDIIEKSKKIKIKNRNSGNEYVKFDLLSIEDIRPIFEGVKNAHNLIIPEILVNNEILKNEIEKIENEESQDPTLFVRLNAGGTTLNGEELMYSVFKSIFPQAKVLVESIGASFISPSKIISIFARIVNVELSEYKSFQKNFTANSFKNELNKNDKFRNKLIEFIISENLENNYAKELINKSIEILRQNKDLSNIFIKNLITSNIELYVVLLIYIHKKNIENFDLTLINEVSSKYVYFLWFARDNKKIASELFKYLIKNDLTWGECESKLIENEYIYPIIDVKIIEKHFTESFNKSLNFNEDQNIKNDLKLKYKSDLTDDKIMESWCGFIEKIRWNNSFLLYAQNEYLIEKFKEFNQFEDLKDTNRPFDWDHIYPKSWVKNKENIHPLVKNWVNTIGNYRALSYDDNRSENNNLSPSQRLKKENNQIDLFSKKNNYLDDVAYWNKLSKDRIKKGEEDIAKDFLFAVSYRMLNLYQYWLDTYYINN